MGALGVGCGTVGEADITITTEPSGRPVHVDGTEHVSPAYFQWPFGSEHTVETDSLHSIGADRRLVFDGWSDGAPRAHTVVTPNAEATLTASLHEQFLLMMEPVTGANVDPGDMWADPGTEVTLSASVDTGFSFHGWVGRGLGSYTGSDSTPIIIMHEPILQRALVEEIGYELSLSASATDPDENMASPANGEREIHLWVTCARSRLNVLETDLSGSLPASAFVPAPGVIVFENPNGISLLIPDCPEISEAGLRLGFWSVLDEGGSACLSGPAGTGTARVTNCDPVPWITVNPVVTGFSSLGTPPCQSGIRGCGRRLPLVWPSERSASSSGGGSPGLRDDQWNVFPHPFVSSGWIELDLPTPSRVQLALHDLAGRRTRRLFQGTLSSGIHRILWDGRNDAGLRVAGGTYFVKLTAGEVTQTRKVVFLGEK
jgi:hypothetical protein